METELMYMMLVQLAQGEREQNLREACSIVGVQMSRHEYANGVYRLFAYDKKDILFVLTRVRLHQL